MYRLGATQRLNHACENQPMANDFLRLWISTGRDVVWPIELAVKVRIEVHVFRYFSECFDSIMHSNLFQDIVKYCKYISATSQKSMRYAHR